jgi:glycine cleavage system H protein
MRYFSKEHEWIEAVSDDVYRIGITDYAQGQLGDIVYAELPAVGKTLRQGDTFAVLESVKAASDVYAPISGTVLEVNAKVSADPALLNQAAESDGWLITLQATAPQELADLMDAAAYQAFIA